ncbi:MAG: PEP-CTERM sorting domain-containing protein [Phycisphaerae bacterium]|nr:PEP-CTERM sorting domain-containing protein [Phycisphaerae bacterium]
MARSLLAGICVLGLVAAAQATIIESEPNNTIPTANPIVVGAKPWADVGVMSLGGAGGDVDFFAITLVKNDVLTVVTTPLQPMFTKPDTLLALFDAANVQLVLDDNSANNGSSTGSTIMFSAPADGTYYLGVTGAADLAFTGGHTETGLYILTASVVPIPEPATAMLLATGMSALAWRRR